MRGSGVVASPPIHKRRWSLSNSFDQGFCELPIQKESKKNKLKRVKNEIFRSLSNSNCDEDRLIKIQTIVILLSETETYPTSLIATSLIKKEKNCKLLETLYLKIQ